MKAVSDFERIFIHRDPVDMRKGINGLCEVVASAEMGDLMKPHLFVFSGRRRGSLKVLYFDKSGFALWQKRLEKEKFPWPKKHESGIVALSAERFAWLLEGYDVWRMRPHAELNFDRVT
jgi:transposase